MPRRKRGPRLTDAHTNTSDAAGLVADRRPTRDDPSEISQEVDRLVKMARSAKRLAKAARDAAKQSKEQREHVDNSLAEMSRRLDKIDALVGAVVQRVDRFEKFSQSANLARFAAHSRGLTDKSIGELEALASALGIAVTRRHLAYAAHRAVLVEERCSGRLATNIGDHLARLVAAWSVETVPVRILEIGTLFGVSLAALHEAMMRASRETHITALDPLDGYYKQSVDPVTGMPVTVDTFLGNLAAVDVPSEQRQLIQLLSTEPEALRQAAERTYDLLIVDGDHSYDGIKNDIDSYVPLVSDGGLVVVDDYGAPSWPDVRRFIDTEVLAAPDAGLARVARVGTSLILRRTNRGSDVVEGE